MYHISCSQERGEGEVQEVEGVIEVVEEVDKRVIIRIAGQGEEGGSLLQGRWA